MHLQLSLLVSIKCFVIVIKIRIQNKSDKATSRSEVLTDTVFPRIIAEAIISIFTPQGGDYSREAIISNVSCRRSCPIYFVLLYQAIKEKVKYMKITIEKTVKKKKTSAFVTIEL